MYIYIKISNNRSYMYTPCAFINKAYKETVSFVLLLVKIMKGRIWACFAPTLSMSNSHSQR